MLTIQNVVGGGCLGVEIDLHTVSNIEFEQFNIQYEPESFSGVVFRHMELNPTVMLFRSGKFNIAGGGSVSETRETFSTFCAEVGGATKLELQPDLEIRYFVTTGQLERKVYLPAASVALGVDETEYEPEQFPGLFYRPRDQNWFAILFTSGSIIMDGEPDMSILESAYEEIDQTLLENNI